MISSSDDFQPLISPCAFIFDIFSNAFEGECISYTPLTAASTAFAPLVAVSMTDCCADSMPCCIPNIIAAPVCSHTSDIWLIWSRLINVSFVFSYFFSISSNSDIAIVLQLPMYSSHISLYFFNSGCDMESNAFILLADCGPASCKVLIRPLFTPLSASVLISSDQLAMPSRLDSRFCISCSADISAPPLNSSNRLRLFCSSSVRFWTASS